MGDIVSLVEKASKDLDDAKIKKTEDQLKQGIFTLDSYPHSIKTNEKNGWHGRGNVNATRDNKN